jgi:hypothetical protein
MLRAMKSLSFAALFLTALFLPAAPCVQTVASGGGAYISGWIGAYSLSEAAPPDVDMVYEVAVCDAAGDAYISVDGHMTEIRLKAKAKQANGRLELYFDSYGQDDMWKKGYDHGDLLLTIAQRGQGFRIVWGALKSQLNEGAKSATAVRSKAGCSATKAPEKWGAVAR